MKGQKRYPQCILATAPIPWDENNQFMESTFRKHVQMILKHGTKHIYIFGTAGEGHAVSDSQYKEITRVFADEMRLGDGIPMVGIISLSLNTIIERIEYARNDGINEFQLSLPSWGACTEEETRTFFKETCGRFPDCNFLHYNLPRVKRLITASEYLRLADEFENLVAIKWGLDSIKTMMNATAQPFPMRVFLIELGFSAATQVGMNPGFLISMASLCWPRAHTFYQAAINGNYETLRTLSNELVHVQDALITAVDPICHMDGCYDKLFAKANQPEFPLRLLPPYKSSDDKTLESFLTKINASQPDWLPTAT